MAIIFRILSFSGWALVGLLGLTSLAGFAQSMAVRFGFLLVALVFCPPLYRYTQRYKKRWSISGRILAFFLGLMIAGSGASTGSKAPVSTSQIRPSVQPSILTSATPSPSTVPSPSPSIESEQTEFSGAAEQSKSAREPSTSTPQENSVTPSPDSTSSAQSINQSRSQSASDPRTIDDRSTVNPATSSITSEPVPSENLVVDPMTPIRTPTYGQGCSCPYDVAKNGSSCGKRSAYTRPGGDAPICYVGDRH